MANRYDKFGRPRPSIAVGEYPGGKAVIIGISKEGLELLKDFNNTYDIELNPFGIKATVVVTGCEDHDSFVATLRKSPGFRDIGQSGQRPDIGPSGEEETK